MKAAIKQGGKVVILTGTISEVDKLNQWANSLFDNCEASSKDKLSIQGGWPKCSIEVEFNTYFAGEVKEWLNIFKPKGCSK